MPIRLQSNILVPMRSVSPVGASRFERPYSPPSHRRDRSDASPTTPDSPIPTPSLASTVQTMTTAPTSLASSPCPDRDRDHDAVSCSMVPSSHDTFHTDADTWFAQFRSDPDLSTSISDECPDEQTLSEINDVPIYSADGSWQPFGSLSQPSQGAINPRQLIVFVRHFYCGACQAYLSALAEGIPPRDYFATPVPTSIIVIGCGAPHLIPHYKRFSNCPFPVFADPSRKLFKRLGMIANLNIGRQRPEYMREISPAAWAMGQVTTISKSLRDPEGIRKRDVLRGGNPMQIGGEFLFEDGRVIWCHRMRNYRDHTEVKQVRRLLELDDD